MKWQVTKALNGGVVASLGCPGGTIWFQALPDQPFPLVSNISKQLTMQYADIEESSWWRLAFLNERKQSNMQTLWKDWVKIEFLTKRKKRWLSKSLYIQLILENIANNRNCWFQLLNCFQFLWDTVWLQILNTWVNLHIWMKQIWTSCVIKPSIMTSLQEKLKHKHPTQSTSDTKLYDKATDNKSNSKYQTSCENG